MTSAAGEASASTFKPGTTLEDEYIVNTVQIRVKASKEAVYDYIILADTPGEMLKKRWPIPEVKSFKVVQGPWDHPGAYRVITLSDCSTAREEIFELRRAEFFAYKVSEFSGLFGQFIDHINGRWYFTQTGDTTLVTWRYCFKYRNALAKPVVRVIAHSFMMPFMNNGMVLMKQIVEKKTCLIPHA